MPVQVLGLHLTTILVVGGCCYFDLDFLLKDFDPKLKITHENTDMKMLFLLSQNLLDEEKELAKQQQEALNGNGKKYEMLEDVVSDGTIRKLAHHYGVRLDD